MKCPAGVESALILRALDSVESDGRLAAKAKENMIE
jgi:hypothetical protein